MQEENRSHFPQSKMMIQEKLSKLEDILRALDRVAVAYSGGTDSSLLLKVAGDILGEGAIGITAISPSLAADELAEAEAVARQIGVRHVLVESHETADPRYLENTPQRCYFCKDHVYDELLRVAHQQGFTSVVDGTNADDAHDHRPGRQAARAWGVRSPLLEAGLTKNEIRLLARQLGLPNWDKPAAACLSSRVPYGTMINLEMLTQVEQAERSLRQIGLRQLRVRHHDQIARIEIEPQDFPLVLARREEILSALKEAGYLYVTLDLAGFRSGSLNEALALNHGYRETAPASD
jgi:pyridinium-3,5-biscarboxylic acid mononucleotide sulfurtransferase